MTDPSSLVKPQFIEIELPVDVALTDDPEQWKPYIDAALKEAKTDHRCLVAKFHVPPELLPPSKDFETAVPCMAVEAIQQAVAEYRQLQAVGKVKGNDGTLSDATPETPPA